MTTEQEIANLFNEILSEYIGNIETVVHEKNNQQYAEPTELLNDEIKNLIDLCLSILIRLYGEYIKPERKDGLDLDFEYTESKCGVTIEYNNNFVKKDDMYLSVAPVIGLHDHTDPALDDNNESFEITGGVITQFGKTTDNGHTFSGSFSAMTDRIVKKGSYPYDSNYFLASAQYTNQKAQLNASINAASLKSGELSLKYVNFCGAKQFKNSSVELSAGLSSFKMPEEEQNLFNITATYKYNIPYKTKK